MLDMLVYYFLVFLCVLISVAFLTLLERKVLGLTQNRKGPNKLGVLGILQPFSDGLKLFSKEEIFILFNNKLYFFLSPYYTFLVSMVVWFMLLSYSGFQSFKLGMLFFLVCVGLGAYGIIFSGWSSNSKYAILGSLRAVAQTVSYELILSFIVFLVSLFFFSYSFQDIFYSQKNTFVVYNLLFMFLMFYIGCVVETNRAPFDLAEGESELVSGFNVEYGGFKFALIFLGEYSVIIWMSMVSVILFWHINWVIFMFIMLMFLWFRSSYPRFRYDFLMSLLWKSYMGCVLFFFVWLFV